MFTSEIGRQSVIEEQVSFFGMKTVLETFQEAGILWYLTHNEKTVANAFASGSTERQCSNVKRSSPGAVFSAEDNLVQISVGEKFSIFYSSAAVSQLSNRERSLSGMELLK